MRFEKPGEACISYQTTCIATFTKSMHTAKLENMWMPYVLSSPRGGNENTYLVVLTL